jgi:hypothetical protein
MNAFNTPAMEALKERLADPKPKPERSTMPPAPSTATPVPAKVERRYDRDRPKVPHTAFMREFQLADGGRLTADRRSIALVFEGSAGSDGTLHTYIAWRTPAKPLPVKAPYSEVVAWWRGEAAGNGKAAERR